ncbi:MAG: type I methionyl aminopeptidase [Candidatus Curtissbacteria bacterium]|nr:type I methionyl aminopeptidase [Candidatus Curtissbacteria bacterium]
MSQVKTKEELELMKISGDITARALKKVLENVKPGVMCIDLDKIAEDEIKKREGQSSFKTVEDYKWTICTTIGNQVVHGIPTNRQLQSGDVLGIDIGAIYKGYHSDMAISQAVGEVSKNTMKFLEIGYKTLKAAIKAAKIGNRIGDISQTIQLMIEGAGYSIVKSLTGHGVGQELHEEPMVPGFGKRDIGPKILEGMVLAIEVIYAKGSGDVFVEPDGWTISTKDKSLAGLFEQTVAITKDGPIVLTPYL